MPPVALGLLIASQVIAEMSRIARESEGVSYDELMQAYAKIAPRLAQAIAGWNLPTSTMQGRDDH